MSHPEPVRVPLVVMVDVSAWMDEYHIESRVEAIADIKNAAAIVFQDWLTESLGFQNAAVRVDL